MVEESLDGADRARRDENAPHLSGDPLRRKLLEPGAQSDRRMQPFFIHRALAVISVEAEEAEDAQIIFLDARLGLADEAHPAGLQIPIAADRIEHIAVAIGVERIEREVATLGVLLPGGRVGDLCVPAEGLDIAAERGHLEGLALDDDRHGAVVDAGRHGFQPCSLSERDHPVRFRGRSKVDLRYREPEERVAHGAANGARLDAIAIERSKHGERSPPLQPLSTGKRRSHGAALKILRDHFEFVAA